MHLVIQVVPDSHVEALLSASTYPGAPRRGEHSGPGPRHAVYLYVMVTWRNSVPMYGHLTKQCICLTLAHGGVQPGVQRGHATGRPDHE